MNNETIATESFTKYKTTYFFDFKEAVNKCKYIVITCSREKPDGTYEKSAIRIFEENFEFTISALSSLFHHARHHPRLKPAPDNQVNGIKSWEPEYRPREKMLEQGRLAMSNAELLAMLIGSGYPGVTAVDLASAILLSVHHDLQKLAALSTEDLTRFSGIGLAKAMSIQSAMELAVRLAAVPAIPRLKAVKG